MNIIKTILNELGALAERIEMLQDLLFEKLGSEGKYVECIEDFDRLSEVTREMDGEYMGDDLLEAIWDTATYYRFHYKGWIFPLDTVKGTQKGFIVYLPDGTHPIIELKALEEEDHLAGTTVWENLEARLMGIYDGWLSKHRKEVKEEAGYCFATVSGQPAIIFSNEKLDEATATKVVEAIKKVKEEQGKIVDSPKEYYGN